MAIETTYTNARANFASLCETAASTGEPVIIHRRGAEDVALVSAAELRSLEETAHLLRSPRNALRLQRALVRARAGTGKRQPVSALRHELERR